MAYENSRVDKLRDAIGGMLAKGMPLKSSGKAKKMKLKLKKK